MGWICRGDMFGVQVEDGNLFFLLHSDGSVALTCEPIKPEGARGSTCLLWTGGHYDVLRLAPAVLATAMQRA